MLETPPQAPPQTNSTSRRWLLFGTGLGIAMGPRNLEWAIVRSRPSGAALVASGIVPDFRTRPAAEWGADLNRSLAAAGEKHVVACLLLPRDEVVVRTLHLAGVPDKEIPAAIELQADTLHPFGDEEISWGWVKTGGNSVLAGIVRKEVLAGYETLFSEAGIGLAAVTFSAAAVHAALRLRGAPPASLLCYTVSRRPKFTAKAKRVPSIRPSTPSRRNARWPGACRAAPRARMRAPSSGRCSRRAARHLLAYLGRRPRGVRAARCPHRQPAAQRAQSLQHPPPLSVAPGSRLRRGHRRPRVLRHIARHRAAQLSRRSQQ